jgi:ATP-dependent exoDNAse (exonuclease V) beta subunit
MSDNDIEDIRMPHRKSFVSAPAGSGKTATIVKRYLLELARGRKPSEIVAITYTRKAAAELIERISEVLDLRGREQPLSAQLQRLYGQVLAGDAIDGPLSPESAMEALAQLPFAPVTTVDSFVQSLVQDYLVDARYVLPTGELIPIDGPVEVRDSAKDTFDDAVRATLDEHAREAGELLSQMNAARVRSVLAALAELDGVGLVVPTEGATDPMTGEAFWNLAVALAAGQQDPTRAVQANFLERVANVLGVEMPVLCERLSPNARWGLMEMQQAAALTQTSWRLSRKVRCKALKDLARRGQSTHTELLRASTQLCKGAAEGLRATGLRKRFRVLLVDEVQDTNPDQLDFYRAFQELLPDKDGACLFVGDSRQSIYRFRAADPHGWSVMYWEALARGVAAELDTNYRSSRLLIDFQRVFVDAIRGSYPQALDSIAHVQPSENALDGLLEAPPGLERPVIVAAVPPEVPADGDKATRGSLTLFARRLGSEWIRDDVPPEMRNLLAKGASGKDTAAVLVSSWRKAAQVVAALSRYGLRAQLSGSASIRSTRAARDTALLLRVLLDTSDDIAWVGMLKHPSIGVSDGALGVIRPFGRLLLDEPGLDADVRLSEADRARLRVALPVLRNAFHQVGKAPTAQVLARVHGDLRWRDFLEAGPEGAEGVADLDIVLDIVAGLEEESVDPQRVAEELESDEADGEMSARRFAAGDRCVEVMTFFQAKGLQFDHVCVPSLDDGSRNHGSEFLGEGGTVEHRRICGRSVLVSKLDPNGGCEPSDDPASIQFNELNSTESQFERYRMAYVAITRARKSVTLGLEVPKATTTSENAGRFLSEALGFVGGLGTRGDVGDAVRYFRVGVDDSDELLTPPELCFPARPQSLGTALVVVDALPAIASTSLLSPSHYAGPHARARAVQANFLKHRQRSPGGAPAPLPGLGGGFDQRTRGDVVHGWFEHWGFVGMATTESAQRYLYANWPRLAEQPGLAEALAALGTSVLAIPGAQALLCERDASLDFETGLVASLDEDVLVGRADLIIRHPDGWVSVVDFKGGWGEVTAGDGLLPNEADYALQLGAYVAMLEAAGKRVRSIALLYAGSGVLLSHAP